MELHLPLLTALGALEGSLFIAIYWLLTLLSVSGMHIALGPLAAVVSTAWCLFVFVWGCRRRNF